ncbi:hypothetical protein JHK82_024930 [Glycine max]|nr:hypothetical protein JHK82_024930 [Glycine max]
MMSAATPYHEGMMSPSYLLSPSNLLMSPSSDAQFSPYVGGMAFSPSSSLGYSPSSPGYSPSSPGYNPMSPGYSPTSLGYGPTSPTYSPSSLRYMWLNKAFGPVFSVSQLHIYFDLVLYSKPIVVRDIPHVPQGQTRKEQVDYYCRTIYPETFYRSIIVTDNKKARSKTIAKPKGTRPTKKTGFLGLVGKKVDTIEYCNEKINELEARLEYEEKVTLREKQQDTVVVFFSSRVVVDWQSKL